MTLEHSPLGKPSTYKDVYTPSLLFPISRKANRDAIGITEPLPFFGYDLWNAYEVSWLNSKGKPVVAMAVITVPAESPYLIESKSLKLYVNSFTNSRFDSEIAVTDALQKDLSYATHSPVQVQLHCLQSHPPSHFHILEGTCLDDADIEIHHYQNNADCLETDNAVVSETLYSHLLKSNCPVTGQPDWGSIEIHYSGKKIHHDSLLKYLIGFRNHNEFHEHCVERIFIDILRKCQPTQLSVYGRYTRRGGLDINPFRSTEPSFTVRNPRLLRQ